MNGWWAASYIVLWILVVSLSILVVALARQIGTLHLRLGPRGALEMDDEGPSLGDSPEAFEVTTIAGEKVSVGGPGEAQLLMFVSPGCMVCEQVLPSVNVVARSGSLTPYVLTDVDDHETRRTFEAKRLPAAVASAPEVARSYGIPGTPYIVVLDRNGIVSAKGTVNNLEQMEGLVDTAQRRLATAAAHSDH
jgi:methylamine dehydrogenase accessory protein MauD